MRGKRYSEEQIIRILGEVEAGKSAAETSREYGVSEATIHRWKSKFGGIGLDELKRLKAVEAENARLKRIVAQQAMDIDALKEVLSKKW